MQASGLAQRLGALVLVAGWMLAAAAGRAEIRFREVSAEAGLRYEGQTYGAAWGDFDADAWPDLWVSNHTQRPSLYLNQRDGSFRDVVPELWSGDPRADAHGAAWADFDNDGDQDLIEVVGAVFGPDGICPGCGSNHFFVNEGGRLRNRAAALGLDHPPGLARTPLWLDADRDGLLDLLVVNQRETGKPASTLYRQTSDGFRVQGREFGFVDAPGSRLEQALDRLEKRLGLRWFSRRFTADRFRGFAQLADLTGDESLELVLYSAPVRIFALKEIPLEEVTKDLGFGSVGVIGDAAVEDFDGDGRMDVYFTRGPYTRSNAIQSSAQELNVRLMRGSQSLETAHGIRFHSEGELTVRLLFPDWFDPSAILVGEEGRSPEATTFRLSPDDLGLQVRRSAELAGRRGLLVFQELETKAWTFRNTSGRSIDLRVHSTKPIERLERLGFAPFREEGVDALFLQSEAGFVARSLAGAAGEPTSCHSVAAADFDNDMDVDLYLVCAGPIENIPNRLLENDGQANFSSVTSAGGAAGSELGRGDAVVTADFDRDGFVDLFVTNGSDPSSPFVDRGPHQLFRNLGNENHWIEIDLVGTSSNRDGIGASVVLEAGGLVQKRIQAGGMHLFSQNHQRMHFGLGSSSRVDRLTIRWPSGTVQRLEDLAANRIVEIRECPQAEPGGRCLRTRPRAAR